MERTTLTIKSYFVRAISAGFILGISTVFTTDHFGKFTYQAASQVDSNYNANRGLIFNRYIPNTAQVTQINYHSPLGSEITIHDTEYNIGDMRFKDEAFDSYFAKSPFYIKATLSDYKYIFLFSLIFSALILFLKKFKIKIS